jgi:hypothetical protein
LTYTNPIGNQVQPMRDVIVQVNYPNGESFQATASPTGTFGGLACAKTGETGFVYFQTSNYYAGFTVSDFGATGFQFASITSNACGTNISSHNSLLRAPVVFEHLISVKANALTLFNRQRGFLNVEIKTASNSSYSPSADKITISDTHVYDDFAGFTHAHEYGHALHAVAFAHGNPGSGGCSGPHFINMPSNLACAYSEGFADYFSILTLPTFHPALSPAQFELNSWVLGYPTQGPSIEGAVAAYFLDMSDGVNAAENDTQALNAAFVANVLSGCVSLSLGAVGDVTGLKYCFEKNLAPSSNFVLNPAVAFPGAWSLGPMQADYGWNVNAVR